MADPEVSTTRTHCSHCGAEVPERALACPRCGSDSDTGWASDETKNEAEYGAFSDEDYEDVIAGLPGSPSPPRSARDLWILLIAAVTLAAFVVANLLA